MIRLSMQVLGTDAAVNRLRTVRARAPEAFAGGVYIASADVLTTAMRLTPVDTGWLRASRYLARPVVSGSRFAFNMGFGASYAVFVHEIYKQYIVGEWKFLQKALDYHLSTFIDQISRHAWRLLAQNIGISSVPYLHPTDPPYGPVKRAYHSKQIKKKRARARIQNQKRIERESRTSLEAQRLGRPPPRPGRG